jgi:hypothetical protein
MTSGDLLNTFPSSIKQVSITLPKKKKLNCRKKFNYTLSSSAHLCGPFALLQFISS